MSKRIVILGAGESGTGAAILAQVKGYNVFVSDQGTIKDPYKTELTNRGIAFEEGKHTQELILSAQLIIKSPGIPEKAEIIKGSRAAGIEVIDEIEFAFRYLNGKVIAITGTNGKTTTTLLTYHLMKSAGKRVALAGNVGESLARKVALAQHDWYILEVSSFQLDGTSTFRPFVGILLNITPDHLDRYEYKMENYINSKFLITHNMTEGDHFIFCSDDPITVGEMKKRRLSANIIKVSLRDQQTRAHFSSGQMEMLLEEGVVRIAQSETTLKGPHNLINTMSAVVAVNLAGLSADQIRAGLKTFVNAPHRLEPVGMINGVEYVNDSKATNVDSVVYALGSFEQPLIWIAGGIDKGNNYDLIKSQVRQKVKVLICLGKENDKLKRAFSDVVPIILETQSVKELVKMAVETSVKGDVVLLSPACASFDLFKNYEDRGNQFRAAVQELKIEGA